MRRFVTATATALFTLAAAAQQPQLCVNPQLVDGLIFLGRSDQKVSVTRGMPVFMSGLRAPTGFSLIGGGTVQGRATKVAYKTALGNNKAYSAMLAALGGAGWLVEARIGVAATFSIAGAPQEGTVCRNGERLGVLAAEFAGASYITINNYPQPRPRECNAPDPGLRSQFGMAPRFRFPVGTTLAQGSGGGSGSSDIYTTSSRIIGEQTPAGLVEYLASQMVELGWQPDSSWSGSRSAGSTWRKTVDGANNWGTLQVLRVSEGTLDVDFTLAQ